MRNTDLEALEDRARLDPGRPIADDRRAELTEFLGHPPPDTPPPSDYDTDLSGLDDDALFAHLERAGQDGLARNLLSSNRLREAVGIVAALRERYASRPARDVRVVDFGCGTSDHGLALALSGFSVTVADLPCKVRFAAWRYRRRGLPVDVLEITSANWRAPRLGHADAIVCGEVLEHLRYPLETARAFASALLPGGVLWVSAYPFREKRRGGSHLEEAYRARGEVLRLMKRDFRRERREGLTGYFMVRRRPGLLRRIRSYIDRNAATP